MSYDLYFYKHKNNSLTIEEIGEYLSNNLTPVNEHGNQWFFENEDTEVYYSFETNENNEEDETEELPDSFNDFEYTSISFNLNFIRPSFFAKEAFSFVDSFISDLDLFIVNPQGEDDSPGKPSKEYLFENWSKTNLWASKEHSSDKSLYYPSDKSNEVWQYNYMRQMIQTEIGENYFVSKSFFFKELQSNKVVTLSMWTEHIPNILPITDYYLLGRQYKKLFKTVKDMILLTKDEFNSFFGKYFEPYSVSNTIIIHPDIAESIEKVFNNVKSNLDFNKHLERVAADSIINVTKDE